jgi:hypothetical protein
MPPIQTGRPSPANRDPTEGAGRDVSPPFDVKNPGQEAEHPGGTPTAAVKGTAGPSPPDVEDQQGIITPNRGN